MGTPLLGATAVLTACFAIGIPLIAGGVLPRIGIDWDPNEYSVSTWLLLVAGGIWYAMMFAVPLVILGLVLSLPGGY